MTKLTGDRVSTALGSLAAWLVAISVSCVAIRGANSEELAIRIEPTPTRPAISKYIYAQFIEHLGRCIYGGIWAEMLEDRKFYYVAGSEDSPWTVLGEPGSVTMDDQRPFVGKHTPRIEGTGNQPSGIAQSKLSLRAEHGYVGSIWLQAVSGRPHVDVQLDWGDAPEDRRVTRFDGLGKDFTKYPLVFPGVADSDHARIQVLVSGQGVCRVGTLSLMPDDNVHGMRADTLALLKELDAPMYRWPGGNFVSGYNWRDGIGPRDQRPPRKNPAWLGVEHNDVGIDEFLAFCREVKAEPLIVVNTGLGDAYSAAQEVEYTNGGPDTIGGAWRVKNGHSEPYGVRWWGVGNEMYGRWQLGHMQLRHYTLKHNEVVEAMRTVDPDLELIGVGALNHHDAGDKNEKRGWSQAMLIECGSAMTLLSEHFYCGAKEDLVEHVRQIPENIRLKAEGHRKLRERFPILLKNDVRIAMDEWNYWHRPYVYGELGCIYHLRDALGIAAGIHEYARNSDIIGMAQYAQTVNVIGCIKTTKTDAAFATTGLVLKLYRKRFGQLPLQVTLGKPDSVVDAAAALTSDRHLLTVGVVNPQNTALTLNLDWPGGKLRRTGTAWTITGTDVMQFNAPGQPPEITIESRPVPSPTRLPVQPFSVTLFQLPIDEIP